MNVKELLSEIQKTKPLAKADIELIEKAYNFSQLAHKGQRRKSGEPYFNHSYEAALKIAGWRLDSKTIAAALLHDIAEDTKSTIEDIKKEFGEEISFLVNGVTKLGRLKYREQNGIHKKQTLKTKKEEFGAMRAENLRKMILALSQDIRVVLIKLADRLHNMKTLSALPPQKQKRIALETSEIYAPLAYRLGMANLSGELEDLAFPYLHPTEYNWLIENVKEKYDERQKYLEKVKTVIEKTLKENKIEPVKIDFRAKYYSSLYKKLLRYDMNLEQIYDLVALRIILKTVEDCYMTLGIIHQFWPPLPGRIKDYIALPKPNGYRSLHTTVFCIDNRPTEFQIRTMEMHDEAENGIAAHWAYTQSKGAKQYLEQKPIFAEKKELAWIRQLKDWQKEFSGSEEFLQSLKIDFFKDRIFAVTPKGEVIDLPAGSTPVDFAYTIHTQIGDNCVGAKINNKIVPLDHQLQSGDLVEILTQKSKKPSDSWLKFVKTETAKKKIKSALKDSLTIIKSQPKTAELKIIVEDRLGMLKDISSTFSQNRVNIQTINVIRQAGYPIVKIRCALNDKNKIEKIIFKLKKIKGVKEINYKLN
ncbi:MAG: GTP pyrophosphokinase [Candidatus Wolfebacteria bacterium GW2011_GWA2_42_10]|uniref:GTP pyrophosphokinase n=2 Tax=Candidatus Wolfeibacteriota TaxID=1752735 RepID=A0A0G0ZST0_9BACT|nr:MAG: GTP pyrophosphokinase [Candidatus Wolfebacteria bacterium GW2011_GWB1_41_12]KKS25061.1 MAG: GTP pyrophosphokinase [Candidatus Wolfebacteria bacterium GW2011_GWA2_42_10]KKT56348.1 MAG: GTP pyrophosphokinase [Candidatus Wolfebacteria bacterium GW2011_GWA1_44_24]